MALIHSHGSNYVMAVIMFVEASTLGQTLGFGPASLSVIKSETDKLTDTVVEWLARDSWTS